MKYYFKNYSKQHILCFFIAFLFVIEGVATFVINFSDYESLRLVGYYKLGLILIFLSLSNIRQFNNRTTLLLGALVVGFLINQVVLYNVSDLQFSIYNGAFYHFFRYIYIFLFIIAITTIKPKEEILNLALKFVETFLFANMILIVLGAIFDIQLFRSYPHGIRFGYDGVFNKVNEVTYFYSILIGHWYFKYLNSKKKLLPLIFLVSGSLLIGTKAIILCLGLLALHYTLLESKYRKVFRILFIPSLAVAMCFFKPVVSYVFKKSPMWSNVVEEYGMVTALTSTRDLNFQKGVDYISTHWDFWNIIFGGPFYSVGFENTEIGFFDFFIFLGLFGTLIYVTLFYNYFFKGKDKKKQVILCITIFIGLLTGGLFLSVGSLIYMYMFVSEKTQN